MLILFPVQEKSLSKDYYATVKEPRWLCVTVDLKDPVSESEIWMQACLSMCEFARVFNCTVYRCVFRFVFLIRNNVCRKTRSLLFFPPVSFAASSQPAYCSGFGIGGQGYRQMGAHLPTCSNQPWHKCHDSEGPRLPRCHGEITSARMNRFNSNGSPALFMHSQTPTSLKIHFFLGSWGGMSESGCDMIMKFMKS